MSVNASNRRRLIVVGVLAVLIIAGLAVLIAMRLARADTEAPQARRTMPVAVAVHPIERGSIVEHRTFSGTLNPNSMVTISARISGRVEAIHTDVGHPVERDELVINLDDDEYAHAVTEASAERTVAEAEQRRAQQARDIAEREWRRTRTLRERGIASESDLDTAQTQFQARDAEYQVAQARLERAGALLRTAEIRRSRAEIRAQWRDDAGPRIVGDRYVEEGEIVSGDQPLLTVLDIDQLRAMISVVETDYGRLRVGQPATLRVDAFPGETFEAQVARLWPRFRAQTRQVEVELRVPNEDHRLRPGMFARVTIELDRLDDATIVPHTALARRDGRDVVFVLDESSMTVSTVEVTPLLRTQRRVAIQTDEPLDGRVVTLGQQLLRDGTEVRVPADERRRQIDQRADDAPEGRP
ncbi:MAG: efflux RND transporter periplasmic adaptor subunit [Phycisphaeraceae bacterium]|nr:efflux RND transporter periplasmic adaptor subunit [Phycisphaeraceae bacterium]